MSLRQRSNHSFSVLPAVESNEVSPVSLKATHWMFVGLCFYMVSQVYAIPLLAIGPSWSLWPNLSDFASLFLIGGFVYGYGQRPVVSRANRKLLSILLIALFGSIISYLFYRLHLEVDNTPGITIGLYQIVRFVQFLTIFWITAHVPLTEKRRKVLLSITSWVFLLVCLGIFLTFFNILPLGTLTMHLPQSPEVAGAWSRYQSIGKYGGQGWGTTGYDHSHVAVNVILLLAMRIHLGRSGQVMIDKLFLLIGIVACFFSESRTGLAAILVFGFLYWLKKPKYTSEFIFVCLVAINLVLLTLLSVDINKVLPKSSEGSLLDRQAGLVEIDSDSLSGRDEIWSERIQLISEHLDLLFFGSGFGAATDTGKKAHFLILHVVLETGLIGLSIFFYFFAHVFSYLHRYEVDVKAIFIATISFFISGLGQDTLYFTVTFIHFTGFYFYSVAIALQNPNINKRKLTLTSSSENQKI